jgi:hypothetical protein
MLRFASSERVCALNSSFSAFLQPRNRVASRIEAPIAGTEGNKLQKATRHGDVGQKMNHLVRLAEVNVGRKRCGNVPHRQDRPRQARLIAQHKRNSAHAFDYDCDDGAPQKKEQAFLAHGGNTGTKVSEFLETAQEKEQGQ